jgi:hypothetical protein
MDEPTLTMLPMVDIHIDATYHTSINDVAYESICRELFRAVLGFILVNRRTDGTYWVVDGATRVLALRRLGVESVVAELVEGWTLEQEREVYQLRNTTFPKHPADLYKAQLLANGLTDCLS